MKKTVIVCDKCGKMQANEKYHFLSLFKERKSNDIESKDYNWEADLCPNCTSALTSTLTNVLETTFKTDFELKKVIAEAFNCRIV